MKTIFCKQKILIFALGLAGASMLSGCKDKNEPQIVQPHDVVYEFGLNNFSAFKPVYYFLQTLDSAEVTNVILQSDEKSWEYTSVANIKYAIDNNIFVLINPEQMKKIKGRGTLYDIYMNDKEDSTYLANMGFEFKNIIYKRTIQQKRLR